MFGSLILCVELCLVTIKKNREQRMSNGPDAKCAKEKYKREKDRNTREEKALAA